jgi:DNA polymerase-3 subunit epsilon
MSQSDWVVLDTETTGRPGEIIDLAILNHEGKVIFDSLLKPTVKIPAEVTRIHGITDDDVQNAASFAELWPSMLSTN